MVPERSVELVMTTSCLQKMAILAFLHFFVDNFPLVGLAAILLNIGLSTP